MQTANVIDFRMTPSFKREIIKIVDNRINEVHATKEDFSELKEIVRELGESQKESQKGISRLDKTMQELAEAQKESKKGISKLDKTMQELAEAQKRTEIKVEELAEAQKETHHELRKLVGEHYNLVDEHKKTRKQLGGLSSTVGYVLEDRAYTGLPELLKRDHGIIVQGRLKRGYMPDKSNKMIEVNIIGEATKDDKRITIIGEGKSQLSKNNIDRFIKIRLERLAGMFDTVFPVLVAYMISEPDVEEYAREKGIALYYSYDF